MQKEQRAGQTFIGLKVSEEMASAVETASKGKDKSQFIREAIAEKLETMNVVLPSESISAPSRKGVGGPRKYKRTKTQNQTQPKI